MHANKEDLDTLINFVLDIAETKGNEWFKTKLTQRLVTDSQPNELNEIYEYCIQQILRRQAAAFYDDFKIEAVKGSLIQDYIRMEKFKREDNFEDFCLAVYQQIEQIVNVLCERPFFKKYFEVNIENSAIHVYNKELNLYFPSNKPDSPKIGELVFYPNKSDSYQELVSKEMKNWYFIHKFRAVLFYHYFNKVVKTNKVEFNNVASIGYTLYQGRNLNHRGGFQTDHQKKTYDDLIPNRHKYYLKFTGFLEDFVSNVNKNLLDGNIDLDGNYVLPLE